MKFQIWFSIIVIAILCALAVVTQEVNIASSSGVQSVHEPTQKNDPLSTLSIN